MGPAATIRLYEEITARTPGRNDQDHLPLLIDSSPQIPDRTDALLHGGADPLPDLVASVRRLVAAGADFLAIACNTAHAWYDPIVEASPVPVLHLIRIAAAACRRQLPAGAPVGVMATHGTVASGLYQAALREASLVPLLPCDAGAVGIMQAIRLVKAGGQANLQQATKLARSQADALAGQGAKVVLLGCTDLSVILRDGDSAVPVVDSTIALAEQIVAIATGQVAWEMVVKASGAAR